MQRRSFFGGLLAAFGLASTATASMSVTPLDPTVARRDARGSAVTRVYRMRNDGDKCEWHEIKPEEVKKGDRIICVGQDGGRLWKCEAFTAASDFYRPNRREAGQTDVADGSEKDLMVAPGEPVVTPVDEMMDGLGREIEPEYLMKLRGLPCT